MKEHPRLFKGEMVRAILAGTKTQTRRILPVQPPTPEHKLIRVVASSKKSDDGRYCWGLTEDFSIKEKSKLFSLPMIGDLIWVKETWRAWEIGTGIDGVLYRADNSFKRIQNTPEAAEAWVAACTKDDRWRPSIFMPRWASRINLEITKIRVERLHDITEEDAQCEGVEHTAEDMRITAGLRPYSSAFARLWKEVYGDHSWNENPMLLVYDFKVAK